MKLFSLLTLLSLSFAGLTADDACPSCAVQQAAPQTEKISWFSDWEQAKAQAKAESKPIFMYFTGSDWCPWCKRMDAEIISKGEFAASLGQKFIFMKVDFPRKEKLDPAVQKQNNELKSTYEVSGFPTVIILDANLNKLGK